MNIKNKLEELITELPDDFEALTFKDLEVGDKFIALPLPDEEGTGYRQTYRIYEKTPLLHYQDHSVEIVANSKCYNDCRFSKMPDYQWVIKIR